MSLIYKLECKLDNLEDKFLELSYIKNTKIEDNYYKLCRLKYTLKNILWKNPLNFLRNIILYRKFLWENMWYDHYYLFNILKLKLEIDAKHYREYGMTTVSENLAREMECCVSLIKRIQEEDDIEQVPKDIDNLFKYISKNVLKWWD